jgi:hypothetical protein
MNPLAAITANRTRYRKLNEQTHELTAELVELVRAAFNAGHTGPEIAAAAGLSPERTYQIRDGRR